MSGNGDERSNESSERKGGELSKDTLRDDLTRILRYGFNFKGTFAFSMPMPHHPNPCLLIDGVGVVGLPLSDRDTHLVATAAGSPTGEDMVQGAILIDHSRVTFKNPKWAPYIDEVVREHVLEALGCAPSKTAPCCELRGLLLQKPGGRFLSPRSAEAPPGMFATVIIVLPSEFTGGNIRTSHGDETIALESATNSLYETTLLAWYTNVNYEAEELMSGYRLALVYNLVHTSPNNPPPSLPSESTLTNCIREVFHKWVSSGYEGLPDDHVAAYVLEEGDRVQTDCMLSVLKAVADAENMSLLLGTLYAHVTGWAEASTGERPLYGLSQGTFESPVMERLYLAKFKVSKLTDIRGKHTHNRFKLILHEDNLVPESPFSGIEPDQKHSHPFTGHGDAPLEYWYDRPALVLFPSPKQLDVLLASGGVEYAIAELEKSASEGPTKENHKIVEYIFQNGGGIPSDYYIFDFRPSYEVPIMHPYEVTNKLADIAVQSNDAKLWVRTLGMGKVKDGTDLSRFGFDRIIAGWEKFQFEEIETALDRVVNDIEDIDGTLVILQVLGSSEVSHSETRRDRWLSEQLDRAFSKEPEESDLPSIMEVAFSKGLHYIARIVMPSFLSQPLRASFWATFFEYLEGSKDRLLALSPSQGQTLSNQELFANILEDARRVGVVDFSTPSTDSQDDDSE